MKKQIITIVLMLTTIVGYTQEKQDSLEPANLKSAINILLEKFGEETVIKNKSLDPITNRLTSSENVVRFSCSSDKEIDPYLKDVIKAADKDAPKAFQIMHYIPKKVVPYTVPKIPIRFDLSCEMLTLSFKNVDDPALSDCYAVTWTKKEGGKIDGVVYIITYTNPSYEQIKEEMKKLAPADTEFLNKLNKYKTLIDFYNSEISKIQNERTLLVTTKLTQEKENAVIDLRKKIQELTTRMQSEVNKNDLE